MKLTNLHYQELVDTVGPGGAHHMLKMSAPEHRYGLKTVRGERAKMSAFNQAEKEATLAGPLDIGKIMENIRKLAGTSNDADRKMNLSDGTYPKQIMAVQVEPT